MTKRGGKRPFGAVIVALISVTGDCGKAEDQAQSAAEIAGATQSRK